MVDYREARAKFFGWSRYEAYIDKVKEAWTPEAMDRVRG